MTEKEVEKEPVIISLTPQAFTRRYNKVLAELDDLERGVYDETSAAQGAALCLLAQAAGLKAVGSYDVRCKSLKRDVDFEKAKAFARIKKNPPDGKKLTDASLAHEILLDDEVRKKHAEYIEAERECKEAEGILKLLNDAHITFRGLSKK